MDEELLTEEQVYDVVKFANALYGLEGSFRNYETDFANKELINLNNNPKIPNYSDLERVLSHYKENAETLQDYSEFMKFWDSIYSKTINYYTNLLSFDCRRYCVNASKEDYKSKEYKDDLKRVYKWFNKFNYRQEFRNVMAQMMTTDTDFVWLRDSEGSYTEEALDLNYEIKRTQEFALQTMPQKNCKITGKSKYCYLWDFDLNYFYNSNININNYDPSLRKEFSLREKTKDIKTFILNKKDLSKTNGYNSSGWTRTDTNAGAWCFKFNTDTAITVPPLANLMKSVFNNDTIAKLQKDKDIASAYALLVGEMKTIKDQNVKEKDPFTINPKTMGQLLRLVQNGLKRNVRPVALPLEETKLMQFNDNSPRMAMNQYRTSASNGSSASSLIYTDDKQGQFEMQSAIITDYNFVKHVYFQFENFLNFFVNKKTKKYKFKFTLTGLNHPFERKERINNLMMLCDKGLTPNTSAFASAFGYDMQEFDAMLEEAHYGNITEVSTMLQNANTMSSKDIGQNGRPKMEQTDLSDSGAENNDYE